AHRLPRPAAVVGALDQLSEPAGALGRVDTIRIGRRSLEMVDLPPSEVRTGDAPPIPLAVRFQHERALARANQHPNPAHAVIPPEDSLVSSNGTSTIRHPSRRVLAARVEPASPGVLALGQERDQADERTTTASASTTRVTTRPATSTRSRPMLLAVTQ